MGVSLDKIKTLREKTGAGMMECKKALLETSEDLGKAVECLRKRGIAKAEKKSTRVTKEGVIGSYIHAGGKIGVLLEINCETDFVARTDDFKQFVKDIAMHIAASDPRWVCSEQVPAQVREKEKEIAMAQMKEKPAAVLEKIAEGKLKKFYAQTCLLQQPFVKDSDKSVDDVRKELIGKLGENITIQRFERFALGVSKEE